MFDCRKSIKPRRGSSRIARQTSFLGMTSFFMYLRTFELRSPRSDEKSLFMLKSDCFFHILKRLCPKIFKKALTKKYMYDILIVPLWEGYFFLPLFLSRFRGRLIKSEIMEVPLWESKSLLLALNASSATTTLLKTRRTHRTGWRWTSTAVSAESILSTKRQSKAGGKTDGEKRKVLCRR